MCIFKFSLENPMIGINIAALKPMQKTVLGIDGPKELCKASRITCDED